MSATMSKVKSHEALIGIYFIEGKLIEAGAPPAIMFNVYIYELSSTNSSEVYFLQFILNFICSTGSVELVTGSTCLMSIVISCVSLV